MEEESDWTTIVDDLFTTHPNLCHGSVVWSSYDIWLIAAPVGPTPTVEVTWGCVKALYR